MEEIAYTSAYQLLLWYQQNKIKPSQVIKSLINRIKKINPELNSLTILLEEFSLKLAYIADQIVLKNQKTPILHGIPVTIKDTYSLVGFPTTAGSLQLKDYYPTENALLVDSWLKNGAIPLAKTNTPSLALDVQTFNDLFGQTVNPWNYEYSPGGSTGGGAVTVATGMVPLALGSDFAGSIRIPAHFCGIFGFKPTDTRISLGGHIPPLPGEINRLFFVASPGWLSRTVKDLQLALQASLDPLTANGQSRVKGFKTIEAPSTQKIKLAYYIDPNVPIEREMEQLIHSFINKLQKVGITVITDNPEEFDFHAVGKLHAQLMDSILPPKGKETKLDELFKFLNKKYEFQRILEKFFSIYDGWIVPVTATSVLRHNHAHEKILVNNELVSYWRALIHYTRPFNATGNPVIVIPLGFTKIGIPNGVQIIGDWGNDEKLLEIAEIIENFLPPLPIPEKY